MKLWPSPDDRHTAFLRDAVRGDREAFRRLYRDLYGPVTAFVSRRIANREDAEDLVSRVFHRLLERLRDFDPARGSATTFAIAIARNAVIDHLRARRLSSPLDDLAGSLADGRSSALDELLVAERDAAVQRLIATLPPGDRELLVLRFGDGLAHREIAALLGLREDAVRQKIFRTLRDLKERSRAPIESPATPDPNDTGALPNVRIS